MDITVFFCHEIPVLKNAKLLTYTVKDKNCRCLWWECSSFPLKPYLLLFFFKVHYCLHSEISSARGMKTLVRAVLAKRSKELNTNSLKGERIFFLFEQGSLRLITFNLKSDQWMERWMLFKEQCSLLLRVISILARWLTMCIFIFNLWPVPSPPFT